MKFLDPREGYDRYAKRYRQEYDHLDSFDWDAARPLIWAAISEGMAVTGAAGRKLAILDAGCGDGRVLYRLQRHLVDRADSVELWGWDISPGMLGVAQKRLGPESRLFGQDLNEPAPIQAQPSGGFDLVLCFFVLVHLSEPRRFFANLAAATRDRATIILNSIPQKEGYTLRDGSLEYQIDYYDHATGDLEEDLLATGFGVTHQTKTEFSTLLVAQKSGIIGA